LKKLFYYWILAIASTFFLLGYNVYSQTIISSSTNWSSISPTPTASTAIEIHSAATLTVDVSNAVCASIIAGGGTNNTTSTLFFNSGSQLTVSGIVTIGVNGQRRGSIDMTNGGTLKCDGFAVGNAGGFWTQGTGTVELTATNTLPASLITTFNNLTISSNTTTLGIDLTLAGTLTLTNSLLILGSINLLLGSTATIGGTPSATNMVVVTGSGELRKTFTGTGSFTFPVGDNTGTAEYSPTTLDFTTGTFSSAYAGVSLVNAKHSSNGSTTDFITRYWTVTSSGISSFSCNVTFTYVDADINGTEANLFCGKLDGSVWTLLLAANTASNELTGTVTSFSVFTGGEESALPVELSSFSASVTRTGVLLNWKTETEVNNYGFEVQRSIVADKWEVLGFVEGHGNSNSPKEYNFIDSEVNSAGTYLYRLKQIDNDGSYEFSKTIEVNFGSPIKFELSQNYPNPFNPSTTISFNLPKSGIATLKVYNLMGEEIITLVEGYREAGIYTINFNAEEHPSGMYLYRLSTNGFTETKKMLFMK